MLTGLPLQEEIDHKLSSSDRACLSELKDVLERFAKTKRFGVSLLHRHFDMADDEVPLESLGEGRTSVTRLWKVADVADVSIATAWRLDGPEPMVVARCSASCDRPPHGNADGRCDYYSEHSNFIVEG